MEKKTYQTPNSEVVNIKASSLLDVEYLAGVSVKKGEDNGEGEAEGNKTSLFDSDDEEDNYLDDTPTLKWGNLWDD